jgi:hypothetical protein
MCIILFKRNGLIFGILAIVVNYSVKPTIYRLDYIFDMFFVNCLLCLDKCRSYTFLDSLFAT